MTDVDVHPKMWLKASLSSDIKASLKLLWKFFLLAMKQTEINIDASWWPTRENQAFSNKSNFFYVYFWTYDIAGAG